MLIYYNSYVIPLKLLFDDSTADRPSTFSSEGMVVLDAIVDACFWADMVLNFRLGFYERHAETGLPDQVVMSPSRIAARYIRLWFWVDLIAVFPIYDIFRPLIASEDADAVIGTSNPLLLLRNLRLVRMLRLVRCPGSRSHSNPALPPIPGADAAPVQGAAPPPPLPGLGLVARGAQPDGVAAAPPVLLDAAGRTPRRVRGVRRRRRRGLSRRRLGRAV